jgi:hypothetical protein
MASPAVSEPPSTPERMPSSASRAPGIFRSASMARTRSRRDGAAAFMLHPPERGVGGERPPLDRDDRHDLPLLLNQFDYRRQHQRLVGPCRQRLQEVALFLEAQDRPLPGGPVDPAVRLLEPAPTLLVQVAITEEGATVDEVVPDIVDRSLHLALRLRAVRAAGPGGEIPVSGEALELFVLHELPAEEAQILRDHRLHLVEEQFPGDAAEEAERLLEAAEESAHVLLRVEPEPQEARVAEDDQERVALAPGERELGEVDLSLVRRRRLETHDRLLLGPWPNGAHILLQLRVSASVAARLDLLEQPHGGEVRKGVEPRLDEQLEGIELGGHRWPGPILHRRLIEVPVEVTVSDPAV